MNINIPDYDNALLKAVKARISSEIKPVFYLMDVLCIGKEAAYRRLRGEVSFTLKEIAILSRQLEISLDDIIGSENKKIIPFHLCMTDFESPSELDYKILQKYIDLIRLSEMDSVSQITVSTNVFPQQIYFYNKSLTKFFLFKWIYENNPIRAVAYHEVKIPEKIQQLFTDSYTAHMQFKTTYFIFDRQLCQYLSSDLEYFFRIGLIRKEDLGVILKETYLILDYMEKIATTGKYSNGNDVYIYVSQINFNKPCCNMKICEHTVSLIEICSLNGIASTDKKSYQKMDNWLQYRRQLSTLITKSGEIQRVDFFNEQRRILSSLSSQILSL
ncbi:MAG: hypothetical protein LBS20_17825 [Prevotella sp.]|nr:hypothetical protein [Prevotella sp.]